MRAVLVSGGLTDVAFAAAYIEARKPDVLGAIDSGMEFFKRASLRPDWIIGDFDSVLKETLSYFESQKGIFWLRLIPKKDDTDTEAAIRKMIELGVDEIEILGATGSRLDHVFGNVELLGIGLEENVSIMLVDKHNRIRMIDHSLCIRKEEQFGDYVSLIPFTPVVKDVTLSGFAYPLNHFDMVCYNSLGVSNQVIEEEAWIEFGEGVLLVFETRD